MKKIWIAMVSLLCTPLLVTAARADDLAHRIILTVRQPVEIPGHVLPPGRYDLTLWDPSNGPNFVRISCHDQNCQYGWFQVNPVERRLTSNTSRVDLEEPAGESMERIKDWFYPGDTEGHAFVYAHSRQFEQSAQSGQ